MRIASPGLFDYVVFMSAPRSLRLEKSVEKLFEAYMTRYPALSGTGALNRLIDEGIRMDLVPGVHFRDGVQGRRAALVGGPEIWEVASVVRAARTLTDASEDQEVLSRVLETTSLSAGQLDTALNYWAQFAEEIDQLVDLAWAEEDRLLAIEANKKTLIRGERVTS